MQLLWHPVIVFKDMINFEQTRLYGGTPNGVMSFLEENKMAYSEGFKIKFSCTFDFKLFPYDSHNCCLIYGIIEQNLALKSATIFYHNMTTLDGQISVHKKLPFPFKVTISSKKTYSDVYRSMEKTYTYPVTGMCLNLKRISFGPLVTSFYIPTISFAFISMISFLIKPDCVSDDIALEGSSEEKKIQRLKNPEAQGLQSKRPWPEWFFNL